MKRLKKKSDLIDELQMLELYYCKDSLEKKRVKTENAIKYVELNTKYIIYRPLRERKLMKSEFDIYIPIVDQLDHKDLVLGNLQAWPMSWDSKIHYATYNFQRNTIEVALEAQINHITPLQQIKSILYSSSSQNHEKLLETLDYIENDHQNFKIIRNEQLGMLEENFVDELLRSKQNEFCTVIKHTLGETLNSKIFVNEKMVNLIGVLPNIFIDAVLQQKKVPTVVPIDNIYEFWTQDAWNFTHSYSKSQEIEFDTCLNIFEYLKIPARVKQTYFSIYNNEQNIHSLVSCQVISLKSPSSYQDLQKKQRILQNSAIYLNENHMNEKNKDLLRDLRTKLSITSQDNWRVDKSCGYRLKSNIV